MNLNILFIIVLILINQKTFADITIIANNGVNMTASEINDVFTGDKTSLNGVKLTLTDNKSALDEFAQKVLKSDAGKYSSTWAKKSFREGIPAPKSKANDSEVIDFVKSTPGGVGYINGKAPSDVKVISKF